MSDNEAIEALGQLAGFEALADNAQVTRLGGLTNRVYRVERGGEAWVLRLPGEGTEAYIDRKVEAHNARAAQRAGVSPELLYADPDSGVMLMRHVEGETMSPEHFRSVAGAPTRAAQAFKQLHRSGETFEFHFELFAMIDDYLKVLERLGATLPEGYHDVVAEAEGVR